MLLYAASGGSTRKRLARLSRDNHVQPNGEGEGKGKREQGNKTTLAGCNLLNDSIGLCAAFHGTVDDLLIGELAHGRSVRTPSAEGKGPIASSISRTIMSLSAAKDDDDEEEEDDELQQIRQNRLHHPVGGPLVGRACLRFLLLFTHEARFSRPMTRVLCRVHSQSLFFFSCIVPSI